jgi:hypothetical protein
MTLAEYIKKHGATACSRKWGVSLRTVNYWASGYSRPRRKQHLPRILKESGLSLADIYR